MWLFFDGKMCRVAVYALSGLCALALRSFFSFFFFDILYQLLGLLTCLLSIFFFSVLLSFFFFSVPFASCMVDYYIIPPSFFFVSFFLLLVLWCADTVVCYHCGSMFHVRQVNIKVKNKRIYICVCVCGWVSFFFFDAAKLSCSFLVLGGFKLFILFFCFPLLIFILFYL